MRRNTFEFLINLLGPDLQKQSVHFGRHPIPVEKQLLLSIWTMATTGRFFTYMKFYCKDLQLLKIIVIE